MSQTPIIVKTDHMQPWPEDKFFYILAEGGLYKCRNHQFYSSAIKVDDGPRELVKQEEFCVSRYPKVPKHLMEQIVAFFAAIADKHDTEAIILLYYNTQTQQVELVCPEQWSEVWESNITKGKFWGGMNIKYNTPFDQPPHMMLIGDVHSHVNITAFASGVDTGDEENRPGGLHLIIGHINREPPQFYADIVVDGERFKVKELDDVMEGYGKRADTVPVEWFEKFSLKVAPPYEPKTYNHNVWKGDGNDGGYGHYNNNYGRPTKRRKGKFREILGL